MGLGMLFIGYFLLLNIFYYTFTDVITGAILFFACRKVGKYESHFRLGTTAAFLFALFGAFEFAVGVIAIAKPNGAFADLQTNAQFYLTLPRYLLLAILTALILMGLRSLGEEVDATDVSGRARRYLPFLLGYYLISAILEIPAVGTLLGGAAPYVYLVLIFFSLVLNAAMLALIYRAYRQICLPEEANPTADLPRKEKGKQE